MSSLSKVPLDPTDLRILQCLQSNARASFRDIGSQVGLTGPAVGERIRRLQEAGVIQGFTVALDAARLGLQVQAFIQLTTPAARYPRVLEVLQDLPGVLECHHVTGGAAFIIHAAVASTAELETLIARLSPFGETATSVVLSSPLKTNIPVK